MRVGEFLIFLLLPLAVLGVWVVYPILATVVLSFTTQAGLSFSNYVEVVSERSPLKALIYLEPGPYPPWGALIHNALWIAIGLPLVIFLGVVLAYLLRETYGSGVVRSIIFLGMVLPGVVSGLVIRFMFDADVGVFPRLFSILGIRELARTWTMYPQTALFALILGSVWLWLGFSVTIFSAGLDAIPRTTVEAAVIDGASSVQVFFKVVLPQLKPVTLVVALMTIMWILKIFDIVYVATGGGPGGSSTVLALIMYNYFASALEYNKAAAVATILALLTLVPATLYVKSVLSGEKQ